MRYFCTALLLTLAAPVASAQPLLQTILPPGGEADAPFATSVAGLPDLDGDGAGDLLVGAPEATAGGAEDAGKAYVFSGATGDVIHELASPNAASSGLGNFGFRFGAAVAGVPDTDGDGVVDLLVGANWEAPPRSRFREGRAYLFSGATGALLHELASLSPDRDGEFGRAVAGVPDADGDGRGDLLVGAPEEVSNGVERAGRAYLFSGATGAPLALLDSTNPEFVGFFGNAVAGVPDVDGDGRGDLLVGAPFEEPRGVVNAGRAYVFSGATGLLLYEIPSIGGEPGDEFGQIVAASSDVNDDGRGDFAVGAYLLSGADGSLIRQFPAPLAGTNRLYEVAAVPDADGDGTTDFLYSNPNRTFGANYVAGRAYLFSGATGDIIEQYSSPEPVDRFGSAIAGVPDVDGDGRGDLAIATASGTGRVYVFGTAPPPVNLSVSLDPPPSPDDVLTLALGDSVRVSYTITNTSGAPVNGQLYYVLLENTSISTDPFVANRGVVTGGTLQDGEAVTGTFTLRAPVRQPRRARTFCIQVGDFVDMTFLDKECFALELNDPAGERPSSQAAEAEATGWSLVAGGAWGPAAASGGSALVAGGPIGSLSAFPNPFGSRTTLQFSAAEAGPIRLVVYDVLGREVAVLVDGPAEVGTHDVALDAEGLPSGAYVVRLEADGRVETRRLTLVR